MYGANIVTRMEDFFTMSTKGVESVKVKVCRLIKAAAQRGELQGDEPLVVLQTLAAKMISEIDDDTNRRAMAKALANTFEDLVEMLHKNELVFRPYEGRLN